MEPHAATPTSIDAYLGRFEGAVRERLEQLRTTVRDAAPAATERISYQMPTFHQGVNLVHFAAHAKHIGLYPGPEAIAAFEGELADFTWSKGAIQFPHDRPLPLDLVRRITAFRVEQATRASAVKRRKAASRA